MLKYKGSLELRERGGGQGLFPIRSDQHVSNLISVIFQKVAALGGRILQGEFIEQKQKNLARGSVPYVSSVDLG